MRERGVVETDVSLAEGCRSWLGGKRDVVVFVGGGGGERVKMGIVSIDVDVTVVLCADTNAMAWQAKRQSARSVETMVLCCLRHRLVLVRQRVFENAQDVLWRWVSKRTEKQTDKVTRIKTVFFSRKRPHHKRRCSAWSRQYKDRRSINVEFEQGGLGEDGKRTIVLAVREKESLSYIQSKSPCLHLKNAKRTSCRAYIFRHIVARH